MNFYILLKVEIDEKTMNGPISYKPYIVENVNNMKTHYQFRNDNGVLTWNRIEFFNQV